MGIVQMITAIAKIFPIVNTWIAMYAEHLRVTAHEEHQKAWAEARKRLGLGDTVGVEEAMGSDNAGKPAVRREGVETRDRKLPLVFLALLSLSSCVSREEVEADIWKNESIPAEICEREPELKKLGIFRVVECRNVPDHPRCQPCPTDPVDPNCQGTPDSFEEFISYCHWVMDSYLSMHEDDALKWLEKLTKPKK